VTVVLDDQAVIFLAQRSRYAREILARLRADWPARVLAVSLVDIAPGGPTEAFLRSCLVIEDIPTSLARDAARLRTLTSTGTAIDALVVAYAQGRTLVTGRTEVPELAALAHDVCVVPV
jgi:hypothetical protein